jgi:soluble lytic murein transglycosylase-like protein
VWGQSATGKIKPLATTTPESFIKKAAEPDLYRKLENKNGLPPGVIAALEYQESRGRDIPGPVTKTGERAQGPFQFMAATAKQYGVKNVHDEGQAAGGTAAMLKDMLDKYKGDLTKALAAYNWGQGNVDKKGMAAAPRETREYVKNIMGRMPPSAPVNINISNATGNNVVATANQIAQ